MTEDELEARQDKLNAFWAEFRDDDEATGELCDDCNGSGEGSRDGTRCTTCKGLGEV